MLWLHSRSGFKLRWRSGELSCMDFNCALIVFVRHPELGKVKTRLAKAIGDEKALQVYQLLLAHTNQITINLNCQKFIFYTESIEVNDTWSNEIYIKKKQTGTDLGKRMHNAFKQLFEQNFKKVLIIGSDCYQLKKDMIKEAFQLLNQNEIVIGPTFDGGYYLLGMNHLVPELFANKFWSTDQVFKQTLLDIQNLNLSFAQLQYLHDVDEAADLQLNGIIV